MNFPYSKLILALSLGTALASPFYKPQHSTSRAAYFLDNDPTGNFIVALKISATDGTVSSPVLTATGGKGLAGLVAVSQDSVVVSEEYLFTVNPGSNTVSMFLINPRDPLHPKLIGTPAPSLGDTPVSVTYSPLLKTACVVNGGVIAGVTCFSVDDKKGLTSLGPLRLIPQTENADPTTPPPGPLVLASDIVFNPSFTAVFIAVRSNGGKAGLVYAWPVVGGHVSTTPVVSSLPDLSIFFSFDFLGSDSRILATNPHLNSPGAAFLDVSSSFAVTEEKIITIPQQVASCWIALAPQFDSAFIIDAGAPNITIVSPETGAVKDIFHFNGTGAQDSRVDRTWLYTMNVPPMNPHVLVFDIQGLREGRSPKQVQSFDLFSALGPFPGYLGLSIYPSG